MARELLAADFETKAIQNRPDYPPSPVGLSFIEPGKNPEYASWGHPTGNGVWELVGRNKVKLKKVSCDPETYAKRKMKDFWRRYILLFHNAKFDIDVASTAWGLPLLNWDDFEDTLFELFLHDPHSRTLSLKPSSERLLGMKPEEQDAVRDWLIDHKVVQKNNKKKWGAYISEAPGDLVAIYACGDNIRSKKLHGFLKKKLAADKPEKGQRSMLDAYNRERRLLPIMLKNEREGIRVDIDALERDIAHYHKEREKCAAWIRKRLKAKTLNIDSDRELAAALDKARVVREWTITNSGQKSVAKDNLKPEHFADREVARALGYHSRLGTSLGTFLEPWFRTALRNKGYIATTWNQVRQSHNESNVGARSGRLSCSPNFMNLPKTWEDKGDGYEHPKKIKLTPLPLCRKYIFPDKGEAFGHRDYNQQEVRILAHFEGDKLCEAFNTPLGKLPKELIKDGRLDVHTYLQNQIQNISGLFLKRPLVKIVVFRTIYGGGASGLAEVLHIPRAQAQAITSALRDAIPGLRALEKALNNRAKAQAPIRTWGGRLYYCEPASYSEKFKRVMTYEYKLLNYLIQGSAADCTKEAVIAYDALKKDGRFLVTVHDEINITAPKSKMKKELVRLQEAMEAQKFDVPMLSDAKVGPCWGEIKAAA